MPISSVYGHNALDSVPATSSKSRSNGAQSVPEPVPHESSTKVTISADAQALAKLASEGIATTEIDSLSMALSNNPSYRSPPVQPATTEDIGKTLDDLGASAAESNTLVKGFDSNKDGMVSQAEILKGLASTANGGNGSQFSQTLLGVMDTSGNSNGDVSSQEFMNVESKLLLTT